MKPEVLSPAGSMDSLVAAVRAGADAVYLGAGSFNARQSAENFSDGDLASAVAYCHIRGVKVYLTLNTLVSDFERSDLLKTAFTAAECGVDAFITEDLGVARIVKKALPLMPLHASTQMSVMSPSAIPLLKEMGFCRIVVAREMDKKSLAEFCAVASENSMEVEVFVHGALCMSVSGQCYLSATLGGRSGNRGMCAGPCRLPFAVSGGTGHDLSLKDLSILNKAGELASMGVCSLKIEGRLKKPEYVAVATAACREAVDKGCVSDELYRSLSDVFSRGGFTDGYYENKRGREMFGTRTEENLEASKNILPAIHELYRRERQSVPIKAFFSVKRGKATELSFSDGENTVSVSGDAPSEAERIALTAESIKEQIGKLGSTPYYLCDIKCEAEENLSLPKSVINALRREAVEELSRLRASVKKFPVNEVEFEPKNTEKSGNTQKIYARFDDLSQIPDDLNGVSAIILPIEKQLPNATEFGVPLIADVPRGMLGNENFIKERLLLAKKNGFSAALCGNLAAVSLARDAGLPVMGDFGLNIFSSEASAQAEEMGLSSEIVSFELGNQDASHLGGNIEKGYISYGRVPLMLFLNCPGKNGVGCKSCTGVSKMTDRKGIEFPVRCRLGFSELLNSRPLYVLDRYNEFSPLSFQVLYFTVEEKEECSAVIGAAISHSSPQGEYTRGNYYNRVL